MKPNLLSMLVYRHFIGLAAVKATGVLDNWKRIVSVLFTTSKPCFNVLHECAEQRNWRTLKFVHLNVGLCIGFHSSVMFITQIMN